ncbi:TetR/AcrR family transcriptional regulator [Nocardia panacis]|uniref:TetR/AcrR family transcriptional regulator n=1 Tax=Nocardia panacis TaxID=2340916 RepID=A0A3A4KRV5_9NOCA|nr:TetR/AcrR family transcriptional regulator [Nocardia panacis]RJO78857.1 TetR/AcrR family transcriptional regulator [Nocardia panacis]
MGRPRNFETDTVVERAMEEFWTRGYTGTSPAQLAAATGVAKGSLYHAFGSKRALFDQALARYAQMGVAQAEELLFQPGNAIDRIRVYLRETVDSDVAQPIRRGCLVVNTVAELGGHDAEIDRVLRGVEQSIVAVLAARIEQGRRDGDFGSDIDARAAADFLLNTSVGLRIMGKTRDTEELYRIIEVALTAL